MLEQITPEHPLVRQLRFELEMLRALPPRPRPLGRRLNLTERPARLSQRPGGSSPDAGGESVRRGSGPRSGTIIFDQNGGDLVTELCLSCQTAVNPGTMPPR